MDALISKITLFFSRIDRRYITFAWIVILLALMALSAGAPSDGGIGNPPLLKALWLGW